MTRPTLDVTLGPLCAAAELLEIELAAKRRTEPKA